MTVGDLELPMRIKEDKHDERGVSNDYRRRLKQYMEGSDEVRAQMQAEGWGARHNRGTSAWYKEIVTNTLAGAALVYGGQALLNPAALSGTSGAATGAALNPTGAGFTGTGPGVASVGGANPLSTSAALNTVRSSLPNTGVPGSENGVSNMGSSPPATTTGTGVTTPSTSGGSYLDSIINAGGDWTTKDTLKTVMGGLGILNDRNATDDYRSSLEEGFNKDNPWSQYQPEYAAQLDALMKDPSKISETPGYQFAFDQGQKALNRKQASTGDRFSGRALAEATEFGTGLASQMWNQEMNRYADLAGASSPTSGASDMAKFMSQLDNQDDFNTTYFLNDIFDRYFSND